jgi:choice-of-anchor B domain-containing protein
MTTKLLKKQTLKKLFLLTLLIPLINFSQTIELKGVLTNGNDGTDIWEYIDQDTNNVYAIVGGNGMSIVDVTDPTNPVQVEHLTNVPGFDVKVWDHYVYCSTSGGGTGRVVDISDPTNAVIVGSFPSPHNMYIDERGYMYNSFPGVRIYDLNPDPTSPAFLTQVGSEGHDVTVRGNLMIDCHGGFGTNLYDVTDPASPILLSSITDPTISYHHQGDISTDGNYLYICDELGNHPQADISVWDISDVSNPQRVSEVADPSATPHNIYVIDDYAYASYYTAGLKIFDVSDPSELVFVDQYDTSSSSGEGFAGAFGVYPSPTTGNIYINDSSGVYIFGFSELNPAAVTGNELNFNFTVSPNPTSGLVRINADQTEINSITLFDIQGKKLIDQKDLNVFGDYELNLSRFNSGIYFLSVNNKETKKIVLK